jgi:Zn-dependent protease
MDPIANIFLVVILIISFMVRNIVYGHVANWLGDPTARLSGRITANPLAHIDPLGSVIIPGLLIFTGTGIILGWPKPMPYNKYNFTNQKWGEVIVGVSGSLANLALAVIFALIIRFAPGIDSNFVDLAVDVVLLNLFLAFFNLIPVPPLDGSKILANLLPFSLSHKYLQFIQAMEMNPLLSLVVILLVFMFFIGVPFFIGMLHLGALLTGFDPNTLLSLYR